MELPFQPTLFDSEPVTFDRSFSRVERIALDPATWVDHAPGWVQGSDALFEQLISERSWGDLLVTGGLAQRAWQHSVPKVAHAGPRISLAFRHGASSRAYPTAPR